MDRRRRHLRRWTHNDIVIIHPRRHRHPSVFGCLPFSYLQTVGGDGCAAGIRPDNPEFAPLRHPIAKTAHTEMASLPSSRVQIGRMGRSAHTACPRRDGAHRSACQAVTSADRGPVPAKSFAFRPLATSYADLCDRRTLFGDGKLRAEQGKARLAKRSRRPICARHNALGGGGAERPWTRAFLPDGTPGVRDAAGATVLKNAPPKFA